MRYLVALLFICMPVFAVEAEKTPEVLHGSDKLPERERGPNELSDDEVEFVKEQYKSSTVIAALGELVQPTSDRGAVTYIVHPEGNPVVKLVAERVFGDAKKMDEAIYGDVYKEADGANHVRIWNVSSERVFLYNKIIAKIKSDPKLLKDLATAIKAAKPEQK